MVRIGVTLAESYNIKGGYSLKGEVSVGGAKNAVLKLLAASIITTGQTKIYNVPEGISTLYVI